MRVRVREKSEQIERWFEIPILIAALLVIPVIVIEQSSWGEPWDSLAVALNWTIWTAFLLELVAMLAFVPDRWRWLRRHPLDVAIVLFTPPFLPSSLQAARLFRLLRVFRLLRLMRAVRRLFSIDGIRYAALLAGLTALGGGAAFAEVEHRSTWTGAYWAVTTMTTVGYGDVSPATDWGRGIAVVVMLVGIGFLTLIIGAIAQRFIAAQVEQVRELEEEEELLTVDAIVSELNEVMARLRRLEANVQRLAR
jgi:voltage-gated potassium channel